MISGVVLAVLLAAPQWRTTPTRTPRPTVPYSEPSPTPTPYYVPPVIVTPTNTPRPTPAVTPIQVVPGEKIRITVEVSFPGQAWGQVGQWTVETHASQCVISMADECAIRIARQQP